MMLATLARASIDGAVFVVLVWVLTRTVPRISAALRATLWWCAAAKFVVSLVWTSPVILPVLPAAEPIARSAPAIAALPPAAVDAPAATGAARSGAEATRAIPGSALALATWGFGLALAGCVVVRRLRQTRDAIRTSTHAAPDVALATSELAARLGLRRVPEVRISDRVGTPLVTNPWRAVILLPARFAALLPHQQRLALCHELMHIRRGDLWLGCVPALAERIFFFHPLVHAATREYVFWREAACDAAVLNALDASPHQYGRLLLDLGITRPRTTLAAAGAPSSVSSLKRRITMLPHASTHRSIGYRCFAAALVLLAAGAIVPLQLAARPSPPPLPSLPAETQPEAAAPRETAIEPGGQRDELNYVLILDDRRSTMSGSMSDIATARRYRKGNERLLWFRRGGREYVVRNPEILHEVEALWLPVNVLGEEQGRLGARQGALGAKQGELGAKQGALGAQQGNLGARQGVLGSRQGALAGMEASERLTAEQRNAMERERRQIEEEMRKLDREMRAFDEKMRELEKPMRELGAEMEALGKEMEAIGRKMEAAVKKAEDDMRRLLDRAIDTGAAELVK